MACEPFSRVRQHLHAAWWQPGLQIPVTPLHPKAYLLVIGLLAFHSQTTRLKATTPMTIPTARPAAVVILYKLCSVA